MTLEVLNTTAAVGTFLVIAASAIAAIAQLRHLRVSNQLNGLLTVLTLMQSRDMRELFDFVRHDLPAKIEDPAFMRTLERVPVDRRQHPELYVCQFFDHIGAHVRSGLIDEASYLRAAWYDTQLYWNLLEPVIMIGRTNRPRVFENFEYLAAKARAWGSQSARSGARVQAGVDAPQ